MGALLDPGVQLDDRQQHGQHDQHHHHAHDDDQQRLQDAWPAPWRGAAPRRRAAWRRAAASPAAGRSARPGARTSPAGRGSASSPPAPRPAARLRAPAPARPSHRRAWRGCQAFRPRPAAPSGSARRRRPAWPACWQSAPRCSRARAGPPAAGSATSRRSCSRNGSLRRSAVDKRHAPRDRQQPAISQPQLRTKALMASIATVRTGQRALELVNTLATCGTT